MKYHRYNDLAQWVEKEVESSERAVKSWSSISNWEWHLETVCFNMAWLMYAYDMKILIQEEK